MKERENITDGNNNIITHYHRRKNKVMIELPLRATVKIKTHTEGNYTRARIIIQKD